ncbi:MAG: hypothetical protein AMS21_05960 [Gemmatimonas sp. SG8_38_2]|nr:MAG: hypothetical protein AMS21_05960 [Gemmatimonas sp. SG8_38_2]
MSPAKSSKRKRKRTGRWSGKERRSGKDRRAEAAGDRKDRGGVRELYKADLDRHLWSWARPSARQKRRKEKERRLRRRRLVGAVASAAGAVGAAGLSYFLYRRLRTDERPLDPEHAQADLEEADFEE